MGHFHFLSKVGNEASNVKEMTSIHGAVSDLVLRLAGQDKGFALTSKKNREQESKEVAHHGGVVKRNEWDM